MRYKNALENCKQRNESIIFPNTEKEVAGLKIFMKNKGISKAWIRLKMTKLKVPRWEIENTTGL